MTNFENHSPTDSEGHDPDTETYHVQFDASRDGGASHAVVTALAAVTGNGPTEIEPLYDVVDPDALDALFQHGSDDSKSGIAVSFELDGSDVTVYSTGEVVASISERGGGIPDKSGHE
ncbi:HalOD1 output domain-containing protein [Haloarcula sp. Atlit-7R]|uniref:HalOD1 output domain-containing protein n=1 Tax=Haloarcula sp. Atlit-7R TaxID=2282125 RepID=UPI000EF14EC5|nr:HalOD1 output domain-containing protein [Haloarcula sp. Atlit-7R]RLM89078.1 hypothetical protein D3D01_20005 [Haloarcula sp. Atlit-7R]